MELLGLEYNGISITIAVGLLLAIGITSGRLAHQVKLPAITGYLVVGILLNPQLFHVIPGERLEQISDVVTPVSLSIIAYIIGGSLNLRALSGLKKSIFIITFFQGMAPFAFVLAAVALGGPWLFGNSIPGANGDTYIAIGLVTGAIALATAPAATVAVLHELKARGPLTTTILGIVALDDALAVIVFALVASPAKGLINDAGHLSYSEMLLEPAIHIVFSIGLGIVFGLLIVYLSRFLKGRMKQLTLVLFAAIILCGGIAEMLNLSEIMANMAFGFVVVNMLKHSRYIESVSSIEDVVFILFFALAGAHFDFSHILVASTVGLTLLVTRAAGKYLGSRLGAQISGVPHKVGNYLGLTLIPQAGVAIGLAIAVMDNPAFESVSTLILSGTITSVIINELIAPPMARYAILKSGEGRI